MDALAAIKSHENPQKAAEMSQYHKAERPYLGVGNPILNYLTKQWRREMDLPTRLATARALWQSNIHEARIAAGKLLTQARIRPDNAVWALILSWMPDLDAWAIADHVAAAGARRITADPARLDEVENWTRSDHMWTRRAALVFTLPFTKSNHPSEIETAARKRILGWAGDYTKDPEWFIQKSVSWWIRSLSQHDPDAARAFLAEHGAQMKPFARKDASRLLR